MKINEVRRDKTTGMAMVGRALVRRRRKPTSLLMVLCVLVSFQLSAQTNNDKNISNSPFFDAEPSLAINPTNPDNIVAAWMSVFGLRIGIKTRHSTDGGATWGTIQQIPHQFPSYQSADPSLVFSRAGAAYLCYIDYKNNSLDSGGVFICKSTNGGASWNMPVLVRDVRETSDLALDRPWIAADKSGGARDGHLYVTSKPAPWSTPPYHLHLKRSTDGGTTWSTDILVDDASFPVVQQSMGVVGVGPTGRLHIVFVSPQGIVGRLACASSPDGGATFQKSVIHNSFGSPDTNYQNGYTLAVNPLIDGNLVVASIDNRNGDPDVLLSYSTNAGANWTLPRRVNDDAIGNGVGQDMVWADFSPNGTLGIAWRDRRLNGPTATVPFDVFTTISTDGGATTRPNRKISSAISAFSSLIRGNDFLGVALDNQNIHVDWGDYRNNNWEIYYNKEAFTTFTGVEELGGVPTKFRLEQNYPNPFNPTTEIRFQIAEVRGQKSEVRGQKSAVSHVTLKVYDVLGKQISMLVNEKLAAGNYSVNFDGNNLASGVYYYTLTADGFVQTKAMVLMK